MKLLLVQHGKNLSSEIDPQKGLSHEGVSEVSRMASHLKDFQVSVSIIKHSSKNRAAQTAEIFSRALNPPEGMEAVSWLSPLDDVSEVENRLVEGKTTMLVGHLPFMEKLVSHLLTGNEHKPVIRFRNGGVACLSNESGPWIFELYFVPEPGK